MDRWYAKAVSHRDDGPLVFYGDHLSIVSALEARIAELEAALTAALALSAPGIVQNWQPTHRHKKRGSTYRVIAEGRLQTGNGHLVDMHPMTIYQGEDGAFWVRAAHEFHDGRFEALARPISYGAQYGSNGERDFMRAVARRALQGGGE